MKERVQPGALVLCRWRESCFSQHNYSAAHASNFIPCRATDHVSLPQALLETLNNELLMRPSLGIALATCIVSAASVEAAEDEVLREEVLMRSGGGGGGTAREGVQLRRGGAAAAQPSLSPPSSRGGGSHGGGGVSRGGKRRAPMGPPIPPKRGRGNVDPDPDLDPGCPLHGSDLLLLVCCLSSGGGGAGEAAALRGLLSQCVNTCR